MATEAPLRRSSRAPVSKAAPVAKAANSKAAAKPASKAKPAAKTSKKRAASTERSPSPPPKRTKNQTTENVNPAVPARPVKKAKTAKTATVVPQSKPYFNPLPTPPEKKRPGLQVFSWGAGNFGQFGMGPDLLGELDKPKKHAWAEEQMEEGTFGDDNAGIEFVAAGGMHTIFVDEKGTIWTCGVNDDAALGRVTEGIPDPDGTLTNVPHPLESLVAEKFRAVQVATGDSICVAVDNRGELRVWGSFRADEGSLGFSETARHQFVPIPVALDLYHKPGDYEKVSAVAAGGNHILVLTTHGHIFTWGSGQQAQLGRKVLERHQMKGTNPQKIVIGARAMRAVVIGAGIYHSFAVDETGTVWGWGLNSMGQTGTGLETKEDESVSLPKVVRGLSKEELGGETVVQISGGNHHTLFLTSDGKVYACGRANSSQLGLAQDDPAWKDADPAREFLSEPVLVTFPDDDDPVVYIAAGLHNNMAITKDGALYCWGQGTQGELGVPDVEVPTPRMIVRREGGSWEAVSVACGGQHTMGLFRKRQK
ncbi:regulator of chromosome condensation 1/beta-lactamase-inhibitor protein II [Mycena belliarum]|uniref:Regulator of chromosome condensation 1/beta-lactamase-inhibitor protein II n=1 Tax=Mycena belliarum TaxID=1033014 RepID=A0AAD6UAR8_9AGAR|nr:regulator of chromosome condensation 1/beta-lactamase-inhibitor protein II [Mycena belliae]